MKKFLIIFSVLVLLFLALPTIKNLILFATYQHGREHLDLEKGNSESIQGIWKGTFDTYQSGLDERHIFKYNFESDSSGIIEYTFNDTRKFFGKYVSNIYDWTALLPYDESEASHYETHFRRDGDYLIIEPSESWWIEEKSYIRINQDKDELYIAIVDTIGSEPENWGIPYSWPDSKVKLIDMVEMWW
jgi:hypothetical protein